MHCTSDQTTRQIRARPLSVLILATIMLLAACGGQDDHYSPPTTRGDRAAVRVGERGPDFTLPDAAGQSVALHDFRGKPTIVVFFRTFG